MKHQGALQLSVPKAVIEEWTTVVDIMAELIGVPAGLIMRIVEPDIEVCATSQGGKHPYRPGDRERLWGSGLYCEAVIKARGALLVPNALRDKKWKNNPDVKHHMISYLGYPIVMPDGRPFGTICVLDRKENAYMPTYEHLVLRFRDLVQSQIEILYINQILGEENKRLSDYLSEIQALRGLVHFCSSCRRIKVNGGVWKPIEEFLDRHPKAEVSPIPCPECASRKGS